MEEKRKSLMTRYRVAISTTIGLIELGYITGIIIVLLMNEGDCNEPIRLWLKVLCVVFGVHLALLVVAEFLMPYCAKCLSGLICAFSASFNAFLGIFMVIWFVLGNIWYFNLDSNCQTLFYEGSACCLGCLLLILISLGSGITNRAADY